MVNDEQAKLSVRCLLFIVYRLLLLWQILCAKPKG